MRTLEVVPPSSADLQLVLTSLAAWCATKPRNTEVCHFTVVGLLPYTLLSKPAAAKALLQTFPDPSPFETLMDTFRAHADREYLNRLTPEHQALVIAPSVGCSHLSATKFNT
jgi:hypothetical protein